MGYYDEISEGYSQLHGEEQMAKARVVKDLVAPKPSDTLLDVGCGDAAYLDIFGCKALGVDPSKSLLARYKGSCKVMQAWAEKLPFKDHQFDIVISLTAIHNFADIEKGLDEMLRVGRDKYAFSVLRRSAKLEWIEHEIDKRFKILQRIVQDKDVILLCTAKH